MSSTITNLQFLEAQLGQYLHSHEDDSTTLWVTPQGFRMPKKKTRDNLEENMKYVEAQLEQYLHSHETVDPFVGGEQLIDGDVENFTDIPQPDGSFAEVMQSQHPDFFNVPWEISTNNPRTGSKHARVSPDGDGENGFAGFIHFGAAQITESGGAIYPATPVSPGNVWTASAWVEASGDFDPSVNFNHVYIRAPGGTEEEFGTTVSSAITISNTYSQVSISDTVPSVTTGGFVPTHVLTRFPQFSSNGGSPFTIDIDNFSVVIDAIVGTLYTTPSGFRFPYDWEEDGDININMKFLETEISKYLHKHVEGTS